MTRLALILLGLGGLFRIARWLEPQFRQRLGEKNLVAQIRTRDGAVGRVFVFEGGKVRSRAGIDPRAQVTLTFDTAELGARLMTPPIDWSAQIAAQKNFRITLDGPEELACWFAQTIFAASSLFGTSWIKQRDGST
ncbi:MAG: molybdopterin-dependent oxidoreductase, partial [Stellaceae bacterium]